jgi:hypothetical protein
MNNLLNPPPRAIEDPSIIEDPRILEDPLLINQFLKKLKL